MKRSAIAFIGATVALAASAHAVLMGPGASYSFPFPPGFGEPDPIGGTIVATLVSPFGSLSGPGFYSGTVTCNVIAGDGTNPFGGLTFEYIIHNNITSNNSINRYTVDGYAGWLVDMSFQPGPGNFASTINRSIGVADTLGWSFADLPAPGYTVIHPGDTTTRLVAQTNAPSWTTVIANVIDGSVTSLTTYGPAVPTPGTSALLGVGLLASARRRRN